MTVTKACYTGVGGVAKKVKSIYVGVNGVARKVKYGYVGVGGVARQFFSAEQKLSYYGAASGLSVARSNLVATSVGDYALFGGGVSYSSDATYHSTVDAYSAALVRSTPTALSVARCGLAAASVGNYALFGGGGYNTFSGSAYHSTVDAYSTALVRSTPTALSVARCDLAAAPVGNYALFGGGYYGGSVSTVDAYSAALVRSTPTVLSTARCNLVATSVGNYALFGGGTTTVDAYSTTLVRSTPTARSTESYLLAATSVGNYALFGGGTNSSLLYSGYSTFTSTVDAYSTALVRSTPTALSVARSNLAAASVGSYALFGGGCTLGSGNNSTYYSTIDAYSTALVRSTPTALSVARCDLAAASVGNYALFGGGGDGDSYPATVDVYRVE